MTGDIPVFATEVEQRLSVMNRRVFHFPDKNGVVASDMRCDDIASQVKECAFQNGNAARRPTIANGQALLGMRGLFALGEVFGDSFLALLEDADAEALFLVKQREHFGALVDTDENQQGVKRNRSEGICGHAVNQARLALSCDHG